MEGKAVHIFGCHSFVAMIDVIEIGKGRRARIDEAVLERDPSWTVIPPILSCSSLN
jgi:hypothetical protein